LVAQKPSRDPTEKKIDAANKTLRSGAAEQS
jgi:hypothetical protein